MTERPVSQEACPRDRHLFAPGAKRILSLDGGGTRGIVTLAFLLRLERRLREEAGDPSLRLCDHFDLIGGTSTGAIIATALALGWTVERILVFYRTLAPRVFRGRWWRLPGIAARYEARALDTLLREELGGRTLDTPDLQTGLAVVTRRIDTASNWVIVNNPRSRFWESPSDGSFTGNRHFCLSQIVRASTAAPTYFAPELIEIVPGEEPGLFVDGALTPHNNPSLLLLMVARMRGFALDWPAGEDRLSITSIGTGSFRLRRTGSRHLARRATMMLGLAAFESAMNADGRSILAIMQALSNADQPWAIDSEIGDQRDDLLGGEAVLRFVRYDLPLEADYIAGLGEAVSPRELVELRRIDSPIAMERLFAMANAAAERQIA